jgi:uncharacterized RDD family membrane protein YckC
MTYLTNLEGLNSNIQATNALVGGLVLSLWASQYCMACASLLVLRCPNFRLRGFALSPALIFDGFGCLPYGLGGMLKWLYMTALSCFVEEATLFFGVPC